MASSTMSALSSSACSSASAVAALAAAGTESAAAASSAFSCSPCASSTRRTMSSRVADHAVGLLAEIDLAGRLKHIGPVVAPRHLHQQHLAPFADMRS